jgi:hypothetical protein
MGEGTFCTDHVALVQGTDYHSLQGIWHVHPSMTGHQTRDHILVCLSTALTVLADVGLPSDCLLLSSRMACPCLSPVRMYAIPSSPTSAVLHGTVVCKNGFPFA